MLINVPKKKKEPKRLKRFGKRGQAATIERAACIRWYLIYHDRICQLCGGDIDIDGVDFAHKKRASQGGKNVVENGLALHRTCHTFSHLYRDVEDALTESPVSMRTGGIVELSPQLRLDYSRHLINFA